MALVTGRGRRISSAKGPLRGVRHVTNLAHHQRLPRGHRRLHGLPVSLADQPAVALLIGLTGGAAFSAWLAHNLFLVAAVSMVLFIGAAALAIKWLNQPYCPPATVVDQTVWSDVAAK